MSEYNIKITKQARIDIKVNANYILNEIKNITAAIKFRKDIYGAIFSLSHMPLRNPLVITDGLSDLNLRIKYMRNYYIFYRVADSRNVKIIRILHAKQDYANIIKENISTTPDMLHESSAKYMEEDIAFEEIRKTSSEFRNNYNMIADICHNKKSHVIITKNGESDLVAMTLSQYEKMSRYIG